MIQAIRNKTADADRIGVFLSVLCAIHCAATPFLLILAPTFGKIWSHPASHWGMALFVVPIAIAMLTSGYRKHKRKWIIGAGSLGIILVIIGSILPYIEPSAKQEVAATQSKAEEEVPIYVVEEDGETVYIVGDSKPLDAEAKVFVYDEVEETPSASCASGVCTDNCCPSLVTDADGNVRLNIPPASIVTTLGGISLIVTHIGNLCCCPGCRRRKMEKSL